jgi:hypothetical protein
MGSLIARAQPPFSYTTDPMSRTDPPICLNAVMKKHMICDHLARAQDGWETMKEGILYWPPHPALHCTALHCTALHCTALHCTALHCIALHCTGHLTLHCTALHCTGHLTLHAGHGGFSCSPQPRLQLGMMPRVRQWPDLHRTKYCSLFLPR